MNQKSVFIVRVTDAVNKLAELQEQITGLAGVYTARGYGSTDPLTDANFAEAGFNMSAATFTVEAVPVMADYLSFCNNVATAAKDRKTSMNKTRTDI
jgi:hypothetical protein